MSLLSLAQSARHDGIPRESSGPRLSSSVPLPKEVLPQPRPKSNCFLAISIQPRLSLTSYLYDALERMPGLSGPVRVWFAHNSPSLSIGVRVGLDEA
jgi:hypothetical protein